jgi:uncharacterized protein (TIGR03382 family)
LQVGELCDDGNAADGDACGMHCRLGNGLSCTAADDCESLLCSGGTCMSCQVNSQCQSGICSQGKCVSLCGNGILDPGELCDNGDRNSNSLPDHCRTTCSVPRCGDGVQDSNEQCDDGNLVSRDGCDRLCRREDGFSDALGDGGTAAFLIRNRPPAGATGPGAVVAMAAGASMGWAWLRRRRR